MPIELIFWQNIMETHRNIFAPQNVVWQSRKFFFSSSQNKFCPFERLRISNKIGARAFWSIRISHKPNLSTITIKKCDSHQNDIQDNGTQYVMKTVAGPPKHLSSFLSLPSSQTVPFLRCLYFKFFFTNQFYKMSPFSHLQIAIKGWFTHSCRQFPWQTFSKWSQKIGKGAIEHSYSTISQCLRARVQ